MRLPPPARRRLRRALPSPIRHRLYDLSPARRRRWSRTPGLQRVAARGVAITFDDGPDARHTPTVLASLDALDVRATFFLLGTHVLEEPELVSEIRRRGHDVALHGMTHRDHDRLSVEEAKSELRAGVEAIESVLGRAPRWYRPPYGRSSPTLGSACRDLGLGLAYWSSWGYDWEPRGPEEIAATVLRDLGPGAIVLLHDSARYAERDDVMPTVEALPAIVGAARDADLDILPLDDAECG